MLQAVEQLERTPEILELLLEGLTDEEAVWKPSPERWSVAEVVEHLSHVEAHGFRSRIDLMLEDDKPELKEYNQEAFAAAGQYSGRAVEDSFDHWADQRETNLELLRELEPSDLLRHARHEKFGSITISDLVNEWAFHDLGHIRQIIELLRSFRYYPNMGTFRTIYTIRP